MGLSPPATSRHLKHLRQEGLIEATADPGDARARIYRLVRDPFAELRAWVDHVEGLWADQLDAFAAHVERTRRGEQP
ncbi:MAG: MarR family transcriptional regulator [Planctomycetota bacterium]